MQLVCGQNHMIMQYNTYIQRVQRKFTWIRATFISNLQSLEIGRLHYALVMTYKFLFGNMRDCFSLANSGYNTRCHCFKLLIYSALALGSTRAISSFLLNALLNPGTVMSATVQDFSSLRVFVFKAFKNTFDYIMLFTLCSKLHCFLRVSLLCVFFIHRAQREAVNIDDRMRTM